MTKTMRRAVPTKLFVAVTNACNVKCRHCMPDSLHQMEFELSGKEIERIIDEGRDLGVGRIAFTGGEALLRRDLLALITHARSRDYRVDLESSASLFKEGKVRTLARAGLKVLCLSLDGATAEEHDSFRGVPGLFEKVLGAAREATDNNLEVRIFCSVSRLNIDSALDLVDVLARERVKVVGLTFAPVTPIGRAARDLDLTIGRKDWLQFYKRFEARRRTSSIPLRIERMFLPLDELSTFRAVFPQDFSCIARERRYCYINPQGNAYGCSLLTGTEHSLGNIRQQGLGEIWTSSPEWEFFGDLPTTEDEVVASCSAGCPALRVANNATGNSFIHTGVEGGTVPICPMVQTPQIDIWPQTGFEVTYKEASA